MSERSHVTFEDLDTKTPAGECPNCGLHVAFHHLSRRQIWPALQDLPVGVPRAEPGFNGLPSHPPDQFRVIEHVLACQRCTKTAVVHQHWGPDIPDLPSAEDLDTVSEAIRRRASKVRFCRLVHPRSKQQSLSEAAPEPVRSLFREGIICQEAGALRAAAALYRAAVEEVCKERNAAGNNLSQKIADLPNKGVPPEVARDLDEARTLGNWSLHDGLVFSPEEVHDVASLIEEAVFVLYVQPEERAAWRASRRQRRNQFRSSQSAAQTQP